MKKEKKVWAITLIACWALAPNLIQAQQDSVRTTQLNDVVVTATKFPKNQWETGKVLTVIDRETINQSAGKDVAQLLNEQVGMIVNGSFSNAAKDRAIYLRGASNAYTLILLDGIPLNDPSGINGGAYDLRLISLDQVERIEILKGSQSTLYGSDAIAGVINIITRSGGSKKIESLSTVSYGSLHTRRAQTSLHGSTPAIDYQIGYSHFDTDGMSEAKDETGAGNFDKDGATQRAFTTGITIRPVKNFSIKPFFRHNEFDGQYDAGAATDDRTNEYESKLSNWGAAGELQVGKGTVYALYGNETSERVYNSSFGNYQYEGIFQNGEVYMRYPLSSKLQVVGGINGQKWFMKDAAATEPDLETTIMSPFASLLMNPSSKFSLEVGSRYNYHSDFGSNVTYSVHPSWSLNSTTKLFFNLSSGFKAPSLYQLYGQFGSNRDLQPEKSLSMELGGQYNVWENRITFRSVVFSRNVEDVIIYTGAFRYDNFDEQRDHGVELEADVKISSKVRLQGHYTYVKGEVRTVRNGEDVTINNLLRRPAHSVGLTGLFQPTPEFSGSITARTFGKRDDQYFDLTDFSTKSVELDPYVLVNAYASYQVRKYLTLFLDVKNVLDTDYEEVYGYSTLGFNVTFGLQVKL